MSNLKGFEGVVSRGLDQLEDKEFSSLLSGFGPRSVPTGRGLAMTHPPAEMEIDPDEKIRLQSDSRRLGKRPDRPMLVDFAKLETLGVRIQRTTRFRG